MEIIRLMIMSSNHNPYTGILSVRENLLAAIDLAKLFKKFADEGFSDEAMDIRSDQWKEAVDTMENFRDIYFAVLDPNF